MVHQRTRLLIQTLLISVLKFKTLKVLGDEYIKVYQAIADKNVPVNQQRLS